MPLHDGVGVNGKKGATTDIKAQVPFKWTKGYMFNDCDCLMIYYYYVYG